jgi:arylsulfatase A-like enzyme
MPTSHDKRSPEAKGRHAAARIEGRETTTKVREPAARFRVARALPSDAPADPPVSERRAETEGPAWARWAHRALELLFSGPIIGALWLLLQTVLAFRQEDDRYMGVRAAPIVEMAKSRFGDDVRGLTWAFAAIAIGYGAAIGLTAELLLAVRERLRVQPSAAWKRWLARIGMVVFIHLAELAYGIAKMPQLYVDTLYSREGALGKLGRALQLGLTDVLGVPGVVFFYVAALLVFVAPPWREIVGALSGLRTRALRLATPAAGLLASLTLALGLASIFAPKRARAGRSGKPNILILAVDSLRDDRVDARVAPRLSSIASSGVRFSHAYVTLPRTLPSWTTILTGREPHHHGLRTMFPRYDDRARDLSALPARLSGLGYKSAVVGDYAADIFTRVRYGFDIVDAPTFNFHALIATRALERATPLLPALQSSIGRKVMPAMRELNQAADPMLVAEDAKRALGRVSGSDSPFFMVVFFSTAHFPYAAPAPWYGKYTDPSYRGRFKYHKPNVLGQEGALDASDVKQVRALYDGAVGAVDDAAGRVLDDLARRGLDDDTIVIVTADHGEMLYDDGHGQGHGDHLFGDQVVHVPLAVRAPRGFGFSPRTIDQPVRDVDLTPTLLELAGAQPGSFAELDGRSLRPLLDGKALPPQPVFAETEVWMTESIPEVPSTGPNPLRLPYPNVAQLTELDPRLAYDVVMRPEAEPLVIAAKHRMVLDGDLKLIYVPTRRGARWLLFDRKADPAETIDVAQQRPSDVARLKSTLWRWMLGDPKMEERDGLLVPRGAEAKGGDAATALRIP